LINPLKSFSQICVEHGIAYSEILKVARHLVFWSQAKIIYPINLKQVYVLSRSLPESQYPEISRAFNSRYSHLEKITFEKVSFIEQQYAYFRCFGCSPFQKSSRLIYNPRR
jgi:hypothetical protein